MALSLFASLIGVFAIAGLAFMVLALVEILRTDNAAWDASGMVQLVWGCGRSLFSLHRLRTLLRHRPTQTHRTTGIGANKEAICQVAFSLVG